jgi:hypothetical protein
MPIDLDILQGNFLVLYTNSLKPSFNHHFSNLNSLTAAGEKAKHESSDMCGHS